ncbi:hypothetical protein SAMN05892877_11783 [Rhizobium subbaraonis]|uniref:VCBS repeat protein n=1 Tax=Rhizobium subbaraonis TaxID=908946 RepID=A0A285UUV5_9HYPH|nr:FG-GAP repeat protein [Rhizobium subbaraonis]SOC45695.1 hypothetical protein SAMN05892877_11783 [Rhizobium subbaraonis]
MRTLRLLAPSLLFSGLAVAASAQDFLAERIFAAAMGDWNKDGSPDLVVIARPSEGSDDNGVYIYLAEPSEARLQLKVAAPNKVWGNLTLFGQEPAVAALANGSIKLTSQNSAVGRDRWEQSLAIAYRNGQFVVAGYTYSSYDTLDPNNTSQCDLNVLTGKGMANGKPVTARAETVTFEAWSDEIGQKACGFSAQ